VSAPGEARPARPDRIEGRALSPRAFRPFGVEAVVLGAPSGQEGLVRREGVALWRRLPEHAPVFDRASASAAAAGGEDGLLAIRVVVATTLARDRALRVPATGERAARARMHAWLREGIARYDERHDLLEGGTSELSPYLHFGCISPRELEEQLPKLRAPGAISGDRVPGGQSRWTRGKELDWNPVKPKLVCEVRYDKLEKNRFRHGTRFIRWRPDKDAKDCTWREVRPPRRPDDLTVPALLGATSK